MLKEGDVTQPSQHENQSENEAHIEPGMAVETTEGDLGTHDISKPVVKDVQYDQQGVLKHVTVEKGVVFKKEIEVPADRIAAVTEASADAPEQGEVMVAADESEIEALHAMGSESLAQETPARPHDADEVNDPLAEVEEQIPTAEGMRRREGSQSHHRAQRPDARQHAGKPSLRDLGPGFISGMAGNDATAVTSYAVVGAAAGFGQLWLLLLATPLYQAVQYACGKIGRVTQKGLDDTLRVHYGRRVAFPAAVLLLIANITLIAGDLVAIGSGFELLTGVSWVWFVGPAALLLWYLTLYQNFATLKKIFVGLSFAFVAYIITGVVSRPDWGAVVRGTFVPHLSLSLTAISSAVALLGATLSPYSMYWQARGETEERRTGTMRQQVRKTALDVAAGTISGNLVAYFIIVSTAATLFAHHQQIATAADAARALQPLLGPFAKYLFALGLIGAGIVAIPVLLASTSYALASAFGWSASLWKKPWQNEGFYLILTVALAISLGVALLHFDPIRLIFWANVLQGVFAPALIVLILLIGNKRAIMGAYRLGRATNVGLVVSVLLTVTGTVLLFYGLLTGQGGG